MDISTLELIAENMRKLVDVRKTKNTVSSLLQGNVISTDAREILKRELNILERRDDVLEKSIKQLQEF